MTREASATDAGNPRCVACQPGFKPVWKVITTTKINSFSYVDTCEIISNCDGTNSSTFNRCDQCRGIYSFVYNPLLPEWTDYQECRKSDYLNCLVFDFSNKKCVKCFTNYVLNKDGICDGVNLYKC